RLVFPERSEAERAAIWRSSCAELGRCAVEWARLPSLSTEVLLEHVEVVGLENLRKAWELGRGVFAITAHYGNFEYIPAVMRAHIPGANISVVGRSMPTPGMQAMIERRRVRGRRRGDSPGCPGDSARAPGRNHHRHSRRPLHTRAARGSPCSISWVSGLDDGRPGPARIAHGGPGGSSPHPPPAQRASQDRRGARTRAAAER